MPVIATALLAAAVAGPVQWETPPGCPERADVDRRLSELLGRVPDEQEFWARGVVHAGPPWRVELDTSIDGRAGRRVLEGADCRAVTEAAVLILVVSIDPLGVLEREGEVQSDVESEVGVLPSVVEERSAEPTTPAPRSVIGPAEEPSPSPPARPRARPWLHVGLGGEAGAVPGGTGGVRLGMSLERDTVFVQLEGSYWIDRLAVLREQPERTGARVGLGTVSLRGGVRLGSARVAVPLSLGLEAGGLRTRGDGLVQARALTFPWVAGSIGTGVVFTVAPRFAVWGSAEAYLPMVRPRVLVGRADAQIELHTVAPVGARALAGISLRVGRR